MTEPMDEGAFPELFEVIQRYAQRDYNHQVKALRIIAAAYLPLFEVPPMPDAKLVVEDILSGRQLKFVDTSRPLSTERRGLGRRRVVSRYINELANGTT